MKKRVTKVIMILAVMAMVLALAACAEKGPDLNSLAIHSVKRTGDKAIRAEVSFDKEYEDVKVIYHSDVDNDTFTGEVEHTESIGDVAPGEMYTVEVKGGADWTYSGTFRQIRVDKDGPQVVPPDMSKETFKMSIICGSETLLEADVAPMDSGEDGEAEKKD